MKITEVRLGLISVPLRVPFKTALRSVSSVEDVIVEIHTDTGAVGYGEAPPTGVITGDTTGAIIGAIRDHIAKTIIGRDVDDFEDLMIALNACIQKNTSAKAAVDMALWDLYGQLYKIPVYKLMGGAKKSIVTDITISVNDPEEMVRDAQNAARLRLPEGQGGQGTGKGYRPPERHPCRRAQGDLHPHRRQSGLDPERGRAHPERDAGAGTGPRIRGAAGQGPRF